LILTEVILADVDNFFLLISIEKILLNFDNK